MRRDDIVPITHPSSGWRLASYVVALAIALALAAAGPADAGAAPEEAGVSGALPTAVAAERRVRARALNPLAKRPPYVDRATSAWTQAGQWSTSRPEDARLIRLIAEQPQGTWLGDWDRDLRGRVTRIVARARAAGAVPQLVAYNIPLRDCGQHSSGGAPTPRAYKSWIEQIARGIGSGEAIVILEPDALAGLSCLPARQRLVRLALMRWAVARLSALPATAVYLDGGNPGWQPAAAMARRLRAAGVAGSRGFAVNVSGFATTQAATAYGHAISRRAGGAHFVIDTSRNGLGPSAGHDWCNPTGRALGPLPSTDTGDPLVDAFLWVKRPGESDGTCNGGPPAGTWWPEYALGLARRSIHSL